MYVIYSMTISAGKLWTIKKVIFYQLLIKTNFATYKKILLLLQIIIYQNIFVSG